MTKMQEAKPSRGRPRDPDLENRVFVTVMQIYSDGGWSGLTFEAVARSSCVGKSSLYRRWDSRKALLRAAMDACWLPVKNIDTGSLPGDLRELAQMIFENKTGEHANISNWLLTDAARFPEVRSVYAPYALETILQGRAIIRRAAARSEIPKSVNHGLVMDLVVGAVNNHVITTPLNLRAEMIRKAPGFLDDLVEVVLRGVNTR